MTVRPPRIVIPSRPEDYGLRAEEVSIATGDGLKLSAWLIPRSGHAAIILLHGYPAEKADMLPIAAALSPRFTILLLDLRYFGKSEGRMTTLGFRERDDLKRVIDQLFERGVTSVGVFGFSLGGAVALMTAAEDGRIGAVAAYAPFADAKTLGHDAYAWLLVLKYPLVEAMSVWARIFLGGDITVVSPVKAVATLAIPLLVIHSRQDDQISFRHAQRLEQALRGNPNAQFYFVDRGRHGELPPDLDDRLMAFFLKSLT